MKWVRPDDVDYDATCALFNAMIARRPAVIAACASADDVREALAYARQHSLAVAVFDPDNVFRGNQNIEPAA
ncbi:MULTISPECIES: hypothetical protein [unclassified Salinibacterium]|uniref:hypothetical protein n=1 Tax=unclassified Salinibacterium TaxID=2632331 RepID=UPI00174A07C6|nr:MULTISPECIES: hypothetical protein [unclassified Salinibacterium]